jgi:hypothetical protein
MGLIYFAAPRLTIWLGPAYSNSDIALTTLRHLASGHPFEKTAPMEPKVLNAGSECCREAIDAILVETGMDLSRATIRCNRNEAVERAGHVWEGANQMDECCSRMRENEGIGGNMATKLSDCGPRSEARSTCPTNSEVARSAHHETH